MDDLLKSFLENHLIEFFGWVIGFISGAIGIYQVLAKSKAKPASTPALRVGARAICVDCNAIIPNSSVNCAICNTTEPFKTHLIKLRVKDLLKKSFYLVDRYSSVDISENTKWYNVYYVPFTIVYAIIASVFLMIDNMFMLYLLGSTSMLAIGFFYYLPYKTLKKYSSHIKISMCSKSNLNSSMEEIRYMISSLADKEVEEELKTEIEKTIKNIKKSKEILKASKLQLSLYIGLLAVSLMPLLLMTPISLIQLCCEVNEDLIGRLVTSFLLIGATSHFTLVTVKTAWLHFFYIDNTVDALAFYYSYPFFEEKQST